MATQRSVVAHLVRALRPFGSLDPDVVDPSTFDVHATTLISRLSGPPDVAGVSEILHDLEALVTVRSNDEPEGVGFFAFGAVVELIYAAQLILGEPRATRWALSRAADVLGFTDDELATESSERMLAWVTDVSRTGDVGEGGEALVAIVAAMATRLRTARPRP
jgi:hypothetical protein